MNDTVPIEVTPALRSAVMRSIGKLGGSKRTEKQRRTAMQNVKKAIAARRKKLVAAA